jgi:hypothetical protein
MIKIKKPIAKLHASETRLGMEVKKKAAPKGKNIKEPKGAIISKSKAIELASAWHGGQFSALYSFASTGKFDLKLYRDYLSEISENKTTSNKYQLELKKLKKWFDYKYWEANK